MQNNPLAHLARALAFAATMLALTACGTAPAPQPTATTSATAEAPATTVPATANSTATTFAVSTATSSDATPTASVEAPATSAPATQTAQPATPAMGTTASPTPAGSRFEEADMELIAAAERGDAESVQRLLAQGASVHARDPLGRTALVAAAYGNHLNVAEILIKA